MIIHPITLRAANAFVKLHHRHHKARRGHKFSVALHAEGMLVGVAIAGRPAGVSGSAEARTMHARSQPDVHRRHAERQQHALRRRVARCQGDGLHPLHHLHARGRKRRVTAWGGLSQGEGSRGARIVRQGQRQAACRTCGRYRRRRAPALGDSIVTHRVYTPRPYAALAMDLFASTPRCALFAKPGMGKTPMVLTFLAFKYDVWGESAPTLVVGPKRVAEHVWPDEVKKWDHLTGLSVVCITGTAAERAAALKLDAPIYTIAYDNLVWLRDHFARAGRAWPFRTVIADESTRLKNFRVQQGGARARAIGEFAHADVETWINLTGTPAPNGLKDLWGQTWFLDAGERLGRSYSSFEDRWFGYKRIKDAITHKVGIQPVIFEHSHHQIHERLADICLTLDPKDWFDLAEPVVNVIEIDLPRRASETYKEFERELFMQLDGNDIEVFNAAAKTMKCLQLANGAVYLEDGKEWVPVHDEKLDALESLVEENAGEPVLCAYHFKSDLARLKVRFPDALDLSVDAEMLAAKAGRGRLWLGHPAGMGHGVDGLQEHCATLAFFGHWWDLEQHDQFIERVGPMRQYQAGKDRAVSIHYIVARGTIDQVVVERRKSKGAVQDLLLDYMKGKR